MGEVLKETRVAPGLLIAMPQLVDPHFHRAVVLMIDHQETGSFGLVMNRPGAIPVSVLVAGFDVAWGGDPSAVVAAQGVHGHAGRGGGRTAQTSSTSTTGLPL